MKTFVRRSLAVTAAAGTLVGCMGVGAAIGAGIGSVLPIAGTSAGGAVGFMIGGAVGGLAAKAVYDSVNEGPRNCRNNPSRSRLHKFGHFSRKRDHRPSNPDHSVNRITDGPLGPDLMP